jgi:hypothetical protein
MPRISGLEKKQASWHLRWFYASCGKCLAGLSRKRRVSLRLIQLVKVRTAARVGCPFEWISIHRSLSRITELGSIASLMWKVISFTRRSSRRLGEFAM